MAVRLPSTGALFSDSPDDVQDPPMLGSIARATSWPPSSPRPWPAWIMTCLLPAGGPSSLAASSWCAGASSWQPVRPEVSPSCSLSSAEASTSLSGSALHWSQNDVTLDVRVPLERSIASFEQRPRPSLRCPDLMPAVSALARVEGLTNSPGAADLDSVS